METLTHIPSNMTNDECFRLTGALPTARIVELLDEADRFRNATQMVKEQADCIRLALLRFDIKAATPAREALKLIEDALAEWTDS